jgi:hypothetical protein
LLPALIAAGATLGLFSATAGAAGPQLEYSLSSDRSNPQPLSGASLPSTDRVYVFLAGASGASSVQFYVDDQSMAKWPWNTPSPSGAYYDLQGTTSTGAANPFDLGSLARIGHTISVAVHQSGGQMATYTATFNVTGSQFSKLLGQDNFTGTSVDTTHWSVFNGAGNNGNGVRSPSAVTEGGGHLTITGSMQNGQIVSGGLQYTTGFTDGYVEFQVKTSVDPAGNMSGVTMLWPTDNTFSEGEDDIYETLAKANVRNPFYTFLHDLGTSHTAQDYYIHQSDASQWHTIAYTWTSGALTVYRDGVQVFNDTNRAVIPTTSHELHIQLDATNSNTLTQNVTMQVGYARMYQ